MATTTSKQAPKRQGSQDYMEESDSGGDVNDATAQNQEFLPEEVKPGSAGFSKAKLRGVNSCNCPRED